MSVPTGLLRRDDEPPTAGEKLPPPAGVVDELRLTGPAPLTLAPTDQPWLRYALAALGVVCVGIGAVGVIVPGLPTAIWLIAASYLFMRSHPRLEAKLVRNRFFGPYLRYVDNPRSMPRRAKFVACGMMWGSVFISVFVLRTRDTASPWFSDSLIAAAALGTWVIVRLRPKVAR